MVKKVKKVLKNNRGFSLMELIIVIAILGVLAGITAPNVIGAIEKSRIVADKSNASLIANAVIRAIVSGDYTATATREAFNNTNFSGVIPKHIQAAPTVKHKANTTSFYVSVDSNKAVTVFAKTGEGTDPNDFTEIYPNPQGDWNK